ncbi:lactonase family protein [Pseudarthrobacter sp. N5]|uniref:lactonase family protein n=1 Tax=Pseudarthrobacter sp. N5 TaxID=3418416 RepID=UPI003CF7DFA1
MTPADTDALIWTGSYTADSGGCGTGIGAVSASADGTVAWLGTAVETDSPSFLAVHPTLPLVYAVGERAQTVQAFRRTGRFGLEPFREAWPAGEAACHVAVDPGGRFLVVACWGDGQVILSELHNDGGIATRFTAAPSIDPYARAPYEGEGSTHDSEKPDAGRPSRAHASLVLSDGRVITTDLGHDLLRVWSYVPGTGLVPDHEVILPEGSGPRHLVQHPGGSVFVVSEYSIEVFVVRPSSETGKFAVTSQGPATFGGALPDDAAAEIALSPDGRHVYAGVRGSNRISVLTVEDAGAQLRPLADIPSGGDWPRHHLVRDRWLHVAHERSGDVTTFALDPASGLPVGAAGPDRLVSGSPTALVLAR